MIIVDLAVEPARAITLVGLVTIVNAVPTTYVTRTKWDKGDPVPVTVTAKGPAPESVQERVEAPEVLVLLSATPAMLRVHTRPVAGETVSVRLTVPV